MSSEGHKTLKGRTMYIPEMCWGSAKLVAAAFGAVGIDSDVVPHSNDSTLEMGRECTSGEECYPQQVTVGDFLGVLQRGEKKAHEVAFFMPRAEGPCRFGQYTYLIRKILAQKGYGEAYVFSPTSEDNYKEMGGAATDLERRIWQALVTANTLRTFFLKTRPYEKTAGTCDRIYEEEIISFQKVLKNPAFNAKKRRELLAEALEEAVARFKQVPVHAGDFPKIGVIGEIFVRQNPFSNDDFIRKLEGHGAEAILTGIPEWVAYTRSEEQRKLRDVKRHFSKAMLTSKIRGYIQKSDEHSIRGRFHDELKGIYAEPEIESLMKLGEWYLPQYGALGEMALNAANVVHFYNQGADGVVDLSPFSCMNGIISEAVYPKISRDHDGFPVRIFYFDGTQSNLDRDIGIFMELVRNYQRKKKSAKCLS
ncbi:MAG: hypothetical protein A3I75_06745 [Deltaproteobacteria bacterium RIFCSPLOWO2_02_FULL_50_16]|nr:MAG: hypothetical protein A2053_05785 [Deltaproteobacteria bacterium GWA2_50_8]OGQ29503.1 MAG: hypothetical protein A3B79_00770 [Deltaproteobacteria bacterium RIFCSPHIGHO2_02_FULL_50_15]OGQ57310.1 MAG: hypothetical protein A3I75_06745 [Deltaproteobacteria bacterium RIFCSPLOWO2_02_FULL_50_16]OGQ66610.1 MAG: hypothetical protein A3F89_05910 [Deltaproteobacteria bacterium RIFCSPLOWO2_12_FULL_50_11]